MQLARAEVDENPLASRGVKALARVRLKDAETGVHQVFHEYGVSAPVPVNSVNLGHGALKAFPYTKISDWVKYLLKTGRLRQLCGVDGVDHMKAFLAEYWKRYKAVHPDHQVFDLAAQGTLQLETTIPVYSHTDEGRSYKHQALWVLSVHGALGRGTRAYIQAGKNRAALQRSSMGMNFTGATWSTQFVFATMLRAVANGVPGALDTITRLFAEDMRLLASEGVTGDDGLRIWCVQVGTKGDLPALTKLAGFKRSFSHVARAAVSRLPSTGVCFYCLAGQEELDHVTNTNVSRCPWEDVSKKPKWAATMNHPPCWDTAPTMLSGVPVCPGQEAAFFKTDIWHNLQLGVAKHWIASSFVVALESLDNLPVVGVRARPSIEKKMEWLTSEFVAFSNDRHLSPYMTEISRETLGFPFGSAFPVGHWSKGSVSTHFMMFLEDFCSKYVTDQSDDPCLQAIVPKPLSSKLLGRFGFSGLHVILPSLQYLGHWHPGNQCGDLLPLLGRLLASPVAS